MSGDEILREAAALMRTRATAASVLSDNGDGSLSPWIKGQVGHAVLDLNGESIVRQARTLAVPHIASWHPAVALAVATWLEAEASNCDAGIGGQGHALAVARAYLGATA